MQGMLPYIHALYIKYSSLCVHAWMYASVSVKGRPLQRRVSSKPFLVDSKCKASFASIFRVIEVSFLSPNAMQAPMVYGEDDNVKRSTYFDGMCSETSK